MKDGGLTRLYDRLTVWERIPLLIAAEAREDKTEYQRLFNASPLRRWRYAEHLRAEQALHVLALIYVTEQLDAAAHYFFDLWQMENLDEMETDDWLLAAQACAYFFTANADAWRRFCSELDIPSHTLTAGNHQGQFLNYCEDNMPANAPSAEALRARFQEAGKDVPELVTADSLLARWRKEFQAVTRHAPLRTEKGER